MYSNNPFKSPGVNPPNINAALTATDTTCITEVTSYPRGITLSSRPIFTPASIAWSITLPTKKVSKPLDW